MYVCVCVFGTLGSQDKQLGFLCVEDLGVCPVHYIFLAYACHPGVDITSVDVTAPFHA